MLLIHFWHFFFFFFFAADFWENHIKNKKLAMAKQCLQSNIVCIVDGGS
jgi:hypothetical protein